MNLSSNAKFNILSLASYHTFVFEFSSDLSSILWYITISISITCRCNNCECVVQSWSIKINIFIKVINCAVLEANNTKVHE